jgi:protein SCO1/2
MNEVGLPPASPIGGSFDLVDHHGRRVTDAAYRGRYVLIFFGFTNCRVVCPRALTRLSAALDLLGPLADRIQPLYITVDPDRDTPEAMQVFLRSYPRFVGLTGSKEQIDRVKGEFCVFARRISDPDDFDGATIRHTAIAYVMGPDGRYVSHFTDTSSSEETANRLRTLLALA